MSSAAGRKSDPVLRVKGVLRETGLSKSRFYVLRASGDAGVAEPRGFPPPDGFLNEGRTPVWLLSTALRWKAAMLAGSKKREPDAAGGASGRSILSLELLVPQVRSAAAGSPSAARQLRNAVDEGEAQRNRGRAIAGGRPRKADDPMERILSINDAALFNALTTRSPTRVEILARQRCGQLEPFHPAQAYRLIAELDDDRPRSVDTVARSVARGNAAAGGRARLSPDKPPHK